MAKLNINTERMDDLINGLKKASDVISIKNLKPRLETLFKASLEVLKKETPVSDASRPDWHKNARFSRGSKHLRDHWKYNVEVEGTSKLSGDILLDDDSLWDLVNLLEAGSPPHRIPAQGSAVLKFYKRAGSGWNLRFAMNVIHPGFKANRFTDRAFKIHEKKSKTLQVEIEKAFYEAIQGRVK